MSDDAPGPRTAAPSADLTRRDLVRLGFGVAAVAAGVSVVAAAAPAQAAPRPAVEADVFSVLLDGVPLQDVRGVEFGEIRAVVQRAPDGTASYGFAEDSTRIRILLDVLAEGPLWDWYVAARNGGQPPARQVIVTMGRARGKPPVPPFAVRSDISYIERVLPIEGVLPSDGRGAKIAVELRCAVGLGRFSVVRA